MVNVDVIRDLDAFEDLRGDWDELLRRSYNDHIFLTHEWLSTWWSVYSEGRSLFILAARDNGRLVGIAPLYSELTGFKSGLPCRRLRFLGNRAVGSAFLDLVVDRDRTEDVLGAFWDFLCSQNDWCILALEEMVAESPTVATLKALAGRDKYPFLVGPECVCPWMALPATWDEFMDLPDKVFKRIVRREGVKKVSKRHEVDVDLALSRENFDWALPRLFETQLRTRWAKPS